MAALKPRRIRGKRGARDAAAKLATSEAASDAPLHSADRSIRPKNQGEPMKRDRFGHASVREAKRGIILVRAVLHALSPTSQLQKRTSKL